MLSSTEENYLKALLRLTSDPAKKGQVGTNQLAARLEVSASTTSDMLKKLREKGLVDYEKYGKISLSAKGRHKALNIVRKHRLWETFLYQKLGFKWDEVHEVAEQLEHIQSEKLVESLDKFLGFPAFDPHGDAIPTADGTFVEVDRQLLSEVPAGQDYVIVSVRENDPGFLKHLSALGLSIQKKIHLSERLDYDRSLSIRLENKQFTISEKIAKNIFCKSA